MLLEATLTTVFRPGTNLKGGAAGGNWSYLLPALDREQVVVVGIPSGATLLTLVRTARRVVVVCRSQRQLRSARKVVDRLRLGDVVQLAGPCRGVPAEVAEGSTDLLVLCNRSARLQYIFRRRNRTQWERRLKAGGHVYFEAAGLEYGLLSLGGLCGRSAEAQVFWLTPQLGESQTFVPLPDRATTQFFLRRGLTAASLRGDLWRNRTALPATLRGETGTSAELATVAAETPAPRRRGGMLQTVKQAIRPVARRARSAATNCERALGRPDGAGRLFARRGVVVYSSGADGSGPPQYLATIAQEFGLSVDEFRWGLSATGDYDSRKLVFFLFESDRKLPDYVVKMTRAKQYNSRLEQERRALELLEEFGIGDTHTLPRVAFFGHHGGLAIVGETAIDGVPFDQKTTADASCPYARGAIQWLTELGAATAAPYAAEPAQVAAGLQQLLTRFAELYSISPDDYSFLAAQIAPLEFRRIPLVFQHGDPGRWNVLVTPQGRVSFLDWEAAERHGMPLWDLLYFLRSFAICVVDAQRSKDRMRGLEQVLLHDSPLAELAVESVRNYCVNTGLPGPLVEPLFHTCWMHRALKEATRLPPAKLREGHYFNFLKLCKEKREAPTLRRMFTLS